MKFNVGERFTLRSGWEWEVTETTLLEVWYKTVKVPSGHEANLGAIARSLWDNLNPHCKSCDDGLDKILRKIG